MSAKIKSIAQGREGWIGAAVGIAAGLLIWASPLGDSLEYLSYDLSFRFKPDVGLTNICMVYMDERSFIELKQMPESWDRALHAALLDRLTMDGAKLVVFDVVLIDESKQQSKDSDDRLVQAIKRNGKVVLGATMHSETRPGLFGGGLGLPLPQFREVAAKWGIAGVVEQKDSPVRQHLPNGELGPSLAWAAATLAGSEITRSPSGTPEQRWLNYYGPQGTLPSVSYCDVSNQVAGHFSGKVVFVGAHPKTLHTFQEAEEFRTPYTLWGGGYVPGVDIMATTFLNLERSDWLRRMGSWKQFLLLCCWGGLVGYGLSLVRPIPATGLAVAGSVIIATLACLATWQTHVWFAWVVLAFVQVPCAWGWAVFADIRKRLWIPVPAPSASRATPELSPEATPTLATPQAVDATPPAPVISDHALITCVGKGAYGEVWLARNRVGMFHAVKIVYRKGFDNSAPYEREFRGIEKFMPVSLKHPRLVHLLHVGRDDAAGYFFYVMEAGDDEATGAEINPAHYTPKTLDKELRKRKRLPVTECVQLGLHLTEALDYLHKSQLIHRDIKPANIIYVGGIPKIADIGLVTDVGGKGRDVTYLGTLGYIAPEGPGTPGADIYSLGKVLYEASMGRSREQFPDLPTSLVEKADDAGLLAMNHIILKACESDPLQRYQSAAQMHADLLTLSQKLAK